MTLLWVGIASNIIKKFLKKLQVEHKTRSDHAKDIFFEPCCTL